MALRSWQRVAVAAKAGCRLFGVGFLAVGGERVDLKPLGVAAFAFHGYRWWRGGFGMGGLYVAPEALNHFHPTYIGPRGVAADVMVTKRKSSPSVASAA